MHLNTTRQRHCVAQRSQSAAIAEDNAPANSKRLACLLKQEKLLSEKILLRITHYYYYGIKHNAMKMIASGIKNI